jgi:hypothetical protein
MTQSAHANWFPIYRAHERRLPAQPRWRTCTTTVSSHTNSLLTCRSSRDSRAAAANQAVEQFLDEDELEELRRTNLQVHLGCMAHNKGGHSSLIHAPFGSLLAYSS